uniref:hypothetical protein n=1 Tax=uncultured Kiloniella sp. TaxID=1133091 RepID=UPI00261465A0
AVSKESQMTIASAIMVMPPNPNDKAIAIDGRQCFLTAQSMGTEISFGMGLLVVSTKFKVPITL